MSLYVNIHRLIWNDDKFPFVSDDCQLVFFHLLTTPMATQFGLFKAGIAGLAEDKRWEVGRYRKAFNEALAEGFVEYDEKALLVRIPHFLDYNKPNNPNVLKSWGVNFNGLPHGELKHMHYQQFKAFVESLPEAFSKAFSKAFEEVLPKGFAKPSGKDCRKDPEYSSDSDSDSDSDSSSDQRQEEGGPSGKRGKRTHRPVNSKKFVVDGKPEEPPDGFNHRQRQAWDALRAATFYIPGKGIMTAWQAVEDPVVLAGQLGGDAYPAVDIALVHRLGNWTMENRQKSKKEIARFLTGRFAASQERGGVRNSSGQNAQTNTGAGDLEAKVNRMKGTTK